MTNRNYDTARAYRQSLSDRLRKERQRAASGRCNNFSVTQRTMRCFDASTDVTMAGSSKAR